MGFLKNALGMVGNAVTGGLASGVGSFVSGLFGGGGGIGYHDQKKLMEKQHGYELENMDYQAKLNEEMAQRNQERQNEYFGMTAEYNSAKNQKQRLKDAGLNPALMYGSAGSGGAGTGSTGGASGSGVGLSQAQAVGMGLQLSQIKAQTNLMNAEAAKAYAEANKVKGIDTKKTEKDIELNLYTLPLDIHKKSEEIESQYLNVVKRVSSSVKIPVAVKIANNFTNLPGFTENLKAYGAKGVVMFNRLYTPDIDISNLRLIPSDAFSHSEEYVKELRWMAIISSLVNNIDLSASTGIHNGTTAIKQILAGAKTVQMCTALYKEGADVIVHALEDIQLFMDKQGFNSVDEFRGKLNYKNIQNPDKFERVQFMKNFGSK